MPRRRALGAAALVLLGALLLLLLPRFASEEAVPGAPPPPAASQASRPLAPPAQSETVTRQSEIAADLNAPGGDIHADLRALAEILDAFRTNLPRDGNPVGDNAEITAALTGRNRLRLVLIPPGHPALNATGELCDRWGTPFFFHAESANRMSVRSAGPDRRMWNEDDVVLEP